MWGALSVERTGLSFTIAADPRPQSFSGPSPSGLMTIFYCLRFETPTTRYPYLYPPGTGWPTYTPRHWVPFPSPPTTRRATVEIFDTTSTRADWQHRFRFSRCSSGADPTENQQLFYCCVFISFANEICLPSHYLAMAVFSGSAICCHMFTVPLLSNGLLFIFGYSSFQWHLQPS
jgi:hypothetical protein